MAIATVPTGMVALCLAAIVAFEGVEAGDPMPRFRLDTVAGELFDSEEDFDAKARVIVFCRLNQSHSLRHLRDLQTLFQEFRGASVDIVVVFAGEVDPDAVRGLVEELKLKCPVLLDPDRSLYGQFGVIVTPATGFAGEDGKLRWYAASHRRDFLQTARANIDLLLGRITEEEREARTAPVRKVRGSSNDPAMAQYTLGRRLLRGGDTEGARKQFVKAWEGEPPLAAAGLELGLLMLREGANERALDLLSKVVDLKPGNLRAVGAKGVALILAGQTDEGGPILQRVVEQGVREPLFYYGLGLWHEKRGDSDAAVFYKLGLEQIVQPRP